MVLDGYAGGADRGLRPRRFTADIAHSYNPPEREISRPTAGRAA
jgi:hypothetical protein